MSAPRSNRLRAFPVRVEPLKQRAGTQIALCGAEGAAALGTFLDATNTPSNIGRLHVRTSAKHPDKQQMLAAGFLEGWLSAGSAAGILCS